MLGLKPSPRGRIRLVQMTFRECSCRRRVSTPAAAVCACSRRARNTRVSHATSAWAPRACGCPRLRRLRCSRYFHRALHHHRHPHVRAAVGHGAEESRRGDPDDDELAAVHHERPVQDVRPSSEPARPEGIAQDGNRVSAEGLVVLDREEAADLGAGPEHGEILRRTRKLGRGPRPPCPGPFRRLRSRACARPMRKRTRRRRLSACRALARTADRRIARRCLARL